MKKKEEVKNKIKAKKRDLLTKGQIIGDVSLFLINFAVIVAMFILGIFLNGIGVGKSSVDYTTYFEKSAGLFFYLCVTMFLVLVAFFAFLYFDNREFLKKASNVEMIFLIIEVSLICSYATGRYINIYFRPLALGALLTLLLVGRRTAIMTNNTISVMIFIMDVFTNAEFTGQAHEVYAMYSSLILGLSTGILAVYLVDGVQARIKVFNRGLILTVPVMICLALLERDNLWIYPERLVSGASSAILSVVLFMAILPVFEALFKKITNYKLAELTDHSAPLIRRLIDEAPGTFNHSIVVSNLAEACAISINENPLLARCAAYYHDMGKLRQPEMFKENQQDGKNVHDDLTPELSTNIIRAHTKDGYELLKKNRLPDEIADVCLEHHGTMPILYFYAKAKKFTDGELDVASFSYLGPKPKTKVASIIMIADSAEAAVRSLKERSRETVDGVVEKLINERLMFGQFDDCDITMKELNIIRNTIVNNLTGVYHERVAYPKVDIEQIKHEEME